MALIYREPGTPRTLRLSMQGCGATHYHLVVSRTTGANGATVARAFENLQDAQIRALFTRNEFEAAGYTVREIRNGAILEVTKETVTRYVFVRPCNLRHAR